MSTKKEILKSDKAYTRNRTAKIVFVVLGFILSAALFVASSVSTVIEGKKQTQINNALEQYTNTEEFKDTFTERSQNNMNFGQLVQDMSDKNYIADQLMNTKSETKLRDDYLEAVKNEGKASTASVLLIMGSFLMCAISFCGSIRKKDEIKKNKNQEEINNDLEKNSIYYIDGNGYQIDTTIEDNIETTDITTE